MGENKKTLTVNEQVNKVVVNPAKFALKRYGLNTLLIILEIGILTVITVMTPGFQGWEYLITPEYIITSIILFLVYTASHWTVFNSKIKRMRDDKEWKEKLKADELEIRAVTRTAEWVNEHDKFLSWRRAEKKRSAWETHIRNAITKLDNRARSRDRIIHDSVITDFQLANLPTAKVEELKKKYDLARQKNRYCRKRKDYEEMLTAEWIALNLDHISVDFDDVDEGFIKTGSLIRGTEKSKTEERGKYLHDNIGSRLAWFAVALFITAFTLQLAVAWDDLGAWMLFAYRMIALLLNILFGIDYADGYFRDVDEHNIESRKSVCGEFLVWRTTTKKEGTQ